MNNNVVITFALVFVLAVLFTSFTTGKQFETWCGDSDSIDGEPEPSHGLNYFQKGEVAAFSASSNQPISEVKIDSCVNATTLSEWYCADSGANTITNVQYTCPENYACSEGSCIYSPQSNIQTSGGVIVTGQPDPSSMCKDSDKGLDIYTKGNVTDNFKTLEDFCVSAITLKEAVCLQQQNQPVIGDTVDIDCPSGSCLSDLGICLPAAGGIIIQQPIPSGNTNCPLVCPAYVTLPEKKAELTACDIDNSKPSRILGDFFKKDDSNQLPPPTECTDHKDNDGDGWIDYKEDLGCNNAADNNETGPIEISELLKAYSQNFTNILQEAKNRKEMIINNPLISEEDKENLLDSIGKLVEKQEFIDSVRERLEEGANIDNLREITKLDDPFESLSQTQNRQIAQTPVNNQQTTSRSSETSGITGLIGGLETPALEITTTIINLGYKELFENLNQNFEKLVRGLQVSNINRCSVKISNTFSHTREMLTYYPCTANTYGPMAKEILKIAEDDIGKVNEIFDLLSEINLQNELLIIKLQDPNGQKQLDETKEIIQNPDAALQENIRKLQKLGIGFKQGVQGFEPVMWPSTDPETAANAQEAVEKMNRIQEITDYPEASLREAEQLAKEARNTGSIEVRNYILGLESRLSFSADDIERSLEDLESRINFMQNSCSDPTRKQAFDNERQETLKLISDAEADLEAARKSYTNIKNARESLEKVGYGAETIRDWINLAFGSADEVVIGFIHMENAILKESSVIQNAIDMLQLNVECVDCRPQVVDKKYIGASGFCETCAREPNQIEPKDMPDILLTDEEKELKKLTDDLNNADTQEELEKAKDAYEKWINKNLESGRTEEGPREKALQDLEHFVDERGAYIDYRDKLNKTIELVKAGNATQAEALIPEIQKALEKLEGEYKENLEENWKEIEALVLDAIKRGKLQEDIKKLAYVKSDVEFETEWQKVSTSLMEINATEEQIMAFKLEIDAKRSYHVIEIEQRQMIVNLEKNLSAAVTQGDFETAFDALSQIVRLGLAGEISATTSQIAGYVSLITENTNETTHISAAARIFAQIGETNKAKKIAEKLTGSEKANTLIFISQFVQTTERVLIYLQVIPDLEASTDIGDKISLALIKAQLGGQENIEESITILVKAKSDLQNSEISPERKILLDAQITNILDQIRIGLGEGIDYKNEIVSKAESKSFNELVWTKQLEEAEEKYSRGEISTEDYAQVLLAFYNAREGEIGNQPYVSRYQLSDIQLLASVRERFIVLLGTLPEGDQKERITKLVNTLKGAIIHATEIEIAVSKDIERSFASISQEGRIADIESTSLKVMQLQEIWNSLVTEGLEEREAYEMVSLLGQGLLKKKNNILSEITSLEAELKNEKTKAASVFDTSYLFGGIELQNPEKIKKTENMIKQLYAYLYVLNSQLSAIELFKARSSETSIEDIEREYRAVRLELYAEADDSRTSRPLPYSEWGVAPRLDRESVFVGSPIIYPDAESNTRELVSGYNELRDRERILFVQLKMRQHNISETDALVLWWESQEDRFAEGVAEAESAIQEIADKPYLLRTFAYSTEQYHAKINRLSNDRIEVFGDILRNLHKIRDPIALARALTIVQTIRQSVRTEALDERFGSFWSGGLAEYTWQADDIESAKESTSKSIRLSRALKAIAVSGIEPSEFISHLQSTSPDYYSILQEAGMIGEGNTLIIPNNPPEWLVSFGAENIPDKHWVDAILNPKQIAITIPTIIIPGAGAGRIAGFIGTVARAAGIGRYTATTLAFGTEVLAFHVFSNIGRFAIGEETDFFSLSGLGHTALVLGGIKIGKYLGELPFHGTKTLIGKAGSITFANAGEVGALTAVTYTEDTERSILQRIGESIVLVAQLRIAGLPTKYFDLRPADQKKIAEINKRYAEIETELRGLVTEKGIRLKDLELVEARRREMSILNQRLIGIYRSNGLLEALTISEPTIEAIAEKSVLLVLGEQRPDIIELLVEAKNRGVKSPEELSLILIRSGLQEGAAKAIAEVFLNVNFVVGSNLQLSQTDNEPTEYSGSAQIVGLLEAKMNNNYYITPREFWIDIDILIRDNPRLFPENLMKLLTILRVSGIENVVEESINTIREFYSSFFSRVFLEEVATLKGKQLTQDKIFELSRKYNSLMFLGSTEISKLVETFRSLSEDSGYPFDNVVEIRPGEYIVSQVVIDLVLSGSETGRSFLKGTFFGVSISEYPSEAARQSFKSATSIRLRAAGFSEEAVNNILYILEPGSIIVSATSSVDIYYHEKTHRVLQDFAQSKMPNDLFVEASTEVGFKHADFLNPLYAPELIGTASFSVQTAGEFFADYVAYKITGGSRILQYLSAAEINAFEQRPNVRSLLNSQEFVRFIDAVRGQFSPAEIESRMRCSLAGSDVVKPTEAVEDCLESPGIQGEEIKIADTSAREAAALHATVREAVVAEGLSANNADAIILLLTDHVFGRSYIHDINNIITGFWYMVDGMASPKSEASIRAAFLELAELGNRDNLLFRFGRAHSDAVERGNVGEFVRLFREVSETVRKFNPEGARFEPKDPNGKQMDTVSRARQLVTFLEDVLGVERTADEWISRYKEHFKSFSIDPEVKEVVTQARLTQILENFIANSERAAGERGIETRIFNLEVKVENRELILVYQDNSGGVDVAAIRDSTIRKLENNELSIKDIAKIIELELAVLFESEGRTLTEKELADLPTLLRSLDLSKPEHQDAVAQFILLQGVSTRKFGGGTGLAGVASGLEQIGGDIKIRQRRDSQGNVRGIEIEVRTPTEPAELALPLENFNGEIGKDFGTAEYAAFVEQYDVSGKGGDFSISFKLKDGTLRTIHLDASGHGKTASQVVEAVRGSVRENAEASLPELLIAIDAELNVQKGEGILPDDVYSAYVIVDTLVSGEVKYVRAGQQGLIVDATTGKTSKMEISRAVGFGIDANEISVQAIDGKGKLIIVLSDGFFEATNKEGKLIGEDTLQALVEETVRENKGKHADEIREAFLQKWEAFVKKNGVEFSDDLSITVLRPGRYEPTEIDIKANEFSQRIRNAPHLKDVILGELVASGEFADAIEVMRVLARRGIINREEIGNLVILTDGRKTNPETAIGFYKGNAREPKQEERPVGLYTNKNGEPILVDNVFLEAEIPQGLFGLFAGPKQTHTVMLAQSEIIAMLGLQPVVDENSNHVKIPIVASGGRTACLDQEMTIVMSRNGLVKGSYFGKLQRSEIGGIDTSDSILNVRGLCVKGVGTQIGETFAGETPKEGVSRPVMVKVDNDKLVETLKQFAAEEGWDVSENWAEETAAAMAKRREGLTFGMPNNPTGLPVTAKRTVVDGKETYTLGIYRKVRELLITGDALEEYRKAIEGAGTPVEKALWGEILKNIEETSVSGETKYKITGVENVWQFFKAYGGFSMMWGWVHHTSGIFVGMTNEGLGDMQIQREVAKEGWKFLSIIVGEQNTMTEATVDGEKTNIGQLYRALVGEPERMLGAAWARRAFAKGEMEKAIALLKQNAPENWKEEYMEDFFTNAGKNLRALLLVDRGNMLGGYPEKDSNWRFEITDMPEIKLLPEGMEIETRKFMIKRFFEILNVMHVTYENKMLNNGENLRVFLNNLFDGDTVRVDKTMTDIGEAYQNSKTGNNFAIKVFFELVQDAVYTNWMEKLAVDSRADMRDGIALLLKNSNNLPEGMESMSVEELANSPEFDRLLEIFRELVNEDVVERGYLDMYENMEAKLEESTAVTRQNIGFFMDGIYTLSYSKPGSMAAMEENVINILELPEEEWLSPVVTDIAEALKSSDQSILARGEIPPQLQKLIDIDAITEDQARALVESAPLIFGGLAKADLDKLTEQKRQKQEQLKIDATDFIYSAPPRLEFGESDDMVFITRERWKQFFERHVERDSYNDKTKLPEDLINKPISVLVNIMLAASSQKGREVIIGGQKQRELIIISQLRGYSVKWVIRTLNGEIVEVFPIEGSIRQAERIRIPTNN